MIKSIRYPRYGTQNPNVTCYVVNLNVLKYISLIPLILPEHLHGDFYITNMYWISNSELTLTYTSRDQTLSSTLLCSQPNFECIEVSSYFGHKPYFILILRRKFYRWAYLKRQINIHFAFHWNMLEKYTQKRVTW